jgi:3-oxoacyl-[acyl-carrier protein] reductase
MARLAGKVAIVTGASRGIGAAIALRLAADGARVIVNYNRSKGHADAVVAAITDAGGEAVAVKADLADPAQIAPLFDAAMKAYGRLDILVNNAAVAERKRLESSGLEHYHKHFDLNVRGALLATVEAAKRMADGGRIINITSGIAKARVARSAVYAGTKAAMEAITRCHAAELGKRNITVNCVAPGLVDTDMLRDAIPKPVEDALVIQTPLGRLGRPDDIADVVAFVASDDARWISGEVIPASGGLG